MLENYGLIIYWEPREHCFVAQVPELLACQASAATRAAALDALEEEVAEWLKASEEVKQSSYIPNVAQMSIKQRASSCPANSEAVNPLCDIDDQHDPAQLVVTYEHKSNCSVISINGEMDITNVERFEDVFSSVVENSSQDVVIELEKCLYIDSSGLATWLKGLKRLRSTGRNLILANPNGFVARVLKITRFYWVLPCFASLFGAIDAANDSEKIANATSNPFF